MIAFKCPHCGKNVKAREELAGKKVKCPGCARAVPVPAEAVSPVPGAGAPGSPGREPATLRPGPAPVAGAHPSTPAESPTVSPQQHDSQTHAGGPRPDDAEGNELLEVLAPPQAADEIGRLGLYRILKVLGQGGMGVVFQAEDPQLERAVAIKAMLPALAASPSARKRFLREAKAAAAIKHHHIVTIHQVGEERGTPFLAMEFLEGEPLDARLQRDPRLPVAEVVRIGREVAEGLEAAHERGLIHRDIKPANIWLEGKQGHVKILDFGLARATADETHLTQTGAIIGTPAYMAPEQAGGGTIDHRCDLFSLGCMLYRMCTGEMPFKGKDTMTILSSLALDQPAAPAKLNAAVPRELSDLVMQLLAKKPEERPASARAVVEALRAIESEQTVTAGRPTLTQRQTRAAPTVAAKKGSDPSRRRWLPLVVGAAVLVVGLVVGVVVFRPLLTSRAAPGAGDDATDAEAVTPNGTAPGKPPVLPDREKPFVLLRKGQAERQFKDLAGALAEQQKGDVIEVQGNGPFEISPVRIGAEGLTLRAAAGYRPSFVRPRDYQPRPAASWFLVEKGSLRVEGCNFRYWGDDGREAAFQVTGPACEFVNCRVVCENAYMVRYGGPTLRFTDSLLAANGFRFLPFHLTKVEEVELTNCVLAMPDSEPFRILEPGCKVRLHNNTIFGCHYVFLMSPMPSKPFHVTATGNVFDLGGGNVMGGASLASRNQFLWEGRNNLYAGGMALVVRWEDGKGTRDLASWNRYWGRADEGSVHPDGAKAQFAWDEVTASRKPQDVVAACRRVTEDIRRRHGPAGGEVGPRWDLVGPGPAYVRALAAAGRPVPRDKLRPEAPGGGPFVLLRGDRDVRGFGTLQKAVDAAQDRDVIEIRSDGEYPGCLFQGSARKALTLRAGAGYLPVINGDLAFRGEGLSLTLEGLHIRGYVGYSGNKLAYTLNNSLARVANCSFESPPDDVPGFVVGTVLQSAGGKPGEIVNCVMPGLVSYGLPPGGRLNVRDSVVGTMELLSFVFPGAADKQLDLERCVVWCPGPWTQGGGWTTAVATIGGKGARQGRLVVTSRQTLFEAANTLVSVRMPLDLGYWKGSGNVYRLFPSPWFSVQGGKTDTRTLAECRRRWNSDADSLEDEPLYLDPRGWRLLPTSPGYKAGPDGKDLGANVDRVAR